MQHRRPLQDHPEFSIREYQGCTEYRVENWRLARDGSRKVLKFYGWSWLDSAIPLLTALFWHTIARSRLYGVLYTLFVAAYLYSRCNQVLWESIIVIPRLGLQFETHRGPFGIPFFASRHFIPLIHLQDFLINEALRGWDVRYYLVALTQPEGAELVLHVPYENILPYFPVLAEVYHGVQESVFNRPPEHGSEEQTAG